MVAVLGGGATGREAQYPFLSSDIDAAASALTVVPLHGRAGKGLLPPHMENGAILSRKYLLFSLPDAKMTPWRSPRPVANTQACLVGPTFMNAIYENSTDKELGSCWGCAVTIAKELPCIYDAIKTVTPSSLLNCGVNKTDVRHCCCCLLDCLC
jgi:hypothetical protein